MQADRQNNIGAPSADRACNNAAGIEHAPGAIAALYAGENSGKKLIYIG